MLTSYFTLRRQVAIGQYVTLKQLFKSDQILTGEVLKFHPILYSNQSIPSSHPNQSDFQILYPPTAGDYDFDNISSKNYKATLKVIDGSNFEISYSLFITRPFATNSNAFNVTGDYEGNVAFFVKIDQDTAVANVPLSVKSFCQEKFEILESGFIPGEDLTLSFKTTGTASNNIYVGLVKNDAISNSVPIVPGLIINYAKISLGASQVDDLPFAAYIEGYGFQEYSGQSLASLTIDGTYLLQNSTYRVYVVYYKNGNWHSCISDVIEQTASNSPIIPTGTFLTTDEFGNEGENCVVGLSEFIAVDLSFTVDVTDFNSQLSAKGLTGTFADYFVSARAFETTNANTFTGKYLDIEDNNPEFKVLGYKPTSSGQKFVIIQLRFDYPTHKDFINFPFDLRYNAVEIPLNISVNEGVGELCSGTEYSIDQTLDEDCFLFQSINGSAYVENEIITGQNIDVDAIPMFGVACFKLVCSDGADAPQECECPPCQPARINIIEKHFTNAPDTFRIAFDDGLNWAAAIIIDNGGTPTVVSYNGVGPTDVIPFTDIGTVETTVEIQFNRNGCYYEYYKTFNIGGNETINYNVDVAPSTLYEDCDCPDPDPNLCLNYASINYECDNETGEITVSTNTSFDSEIENEDLLCSTDGGLTFIPCPESILGFESVFLTYDVSFTDGCNPIHLEQVVECVLIPYDINGREIELSVSGNLLNITLTDDFASDVLSDKLYVSLDNGETYTKFNLLDEGYTPMSIVGDEKVIVYTETIFEDGHVDLIRTKKMNLSIPNGDCEGYTGYTLAAAYNEETNQFTVTKAGDESSLVVNQLLWTIGGGNPFDQNQSGVPYIAPVNGEGIFIARWKIKKTNCEELILDAMAWGKACIKLCDNINISLDPIELPEININFPTEPLQVCIVECCEETELTVDCIDETLIVTGAAEGAVITWAGPNGFTAAGNNVPVGDEGTYTVTSTQGECVSTATYEHECVDAGEPIEEEFEV